MTDNRTTELLPCPFCGGEAEPFNPFDNADGTWCVLCSECASATGFEQTEAEAIAAWNARAVRTCHNTHENRWFKCSACGYGFTDLYAEDESDIDEQPRYCPNCGAKVVDE